MFLYALAMLLLFHTKAKETIVAIVATRLSQNLFKWGASGFYILTVGKIRFTLGTSKMRTFLFYFSGEGCGVGLDTYVH